MDDSVFLHWSPSEARIKGFSTANRGRTTTVKIELEVSDHYTLGRILSELQEAQAKGTRKRPAGKERRSASDPLSEEVMRLPAPRLALPAPSRREYE